MLGAYIPHRKKNFHVVGLKFFYPALETQLELETMSIHNAKSLKRANENKYALQTPTLDEAK